ncbi:Uncharacterised protein [Salmonella enterica subsp. enterica serovar Typhi]|nr:Uncharacterised protein [Salmonella enterica subsp. enterica serovar Typhi]CHC91368.1 Uncharacterised protein [Salmonella enterica subsp. enterica serovar Typhi]CHE28772.1 Uncharacterised protein [Salmonella enterica subsp. enterica serovar Typhi]CHG88219.1 Uncharacterised protein [Salmonella enterica subsp. enterica serovar Typhi]CIJ81250.1 Uncharacterised protein [Salmonella enterica subsp. enterica serovar Typhi]
MVKPDRVAIAYHHIVKIRPALQFIRNYRQAFIVPVFYGSDNAVVRSNNFCLIHRHVTNMGRQIIFETGRQILC